MGVRPQRWKIVHHMGGNVRKLGKVCNFFLTLSSEYLRTHVCIAMHLPRAPRRKRNSNFTNRVLLTCDTASCVIHIEQFFATSKARAAATPFELLLHSYRAGD